MSERAKVGQSYIFKFRYPVGTGRIRKEPTTSPSIKNKYYNWNEISGKQVRVVNSDVIHNIRIYIEQDGTDFWFHSNSCYLFECTCDLILIMNRGCQCGFFTIEQENIGS